MGRLELAKGPQVILEALASAPDLPVKLSICGTGPLSESLQEKYGHDQRVSFEGRVEGERKQNILKSADVMIVPSLWYEPFNRTVIEAFQHGVAVVASNRGGLPELIEDHLTGRLFQPGNSKELASILWEIYYQPNNLQTVKRNARNRAQKYSLTKHVMQYEGVYRAVLR
jgi:glycosyltransferase involved in cell wall biosynthesis